MSCDDKARKAIQINAVYGSTIPVTILGAMVAGRSRKNDFFNQIMVIPNTITGVKSVLNSERTGESMTIKNIDAAKTIPTYLRQTKENMINSKFNADYRELSRKSLEYMTDKLTKGVIMADLFISDGNTPTCYEKKLHVIQTASVIPYLDDYCQNPLAKIEVYMILEKYANDDDTEVREIARKAIFDNQLDSKNGLLNNEDRTTSG